MATYNKLTEKQVAALLPLEKRAKQIKWEKAELENGLALENLDYDKTQEIRAQIESLENEAVEVSKHIEFIYNARSIFDALVQKCDTQLQIADNMRREYGF